MASPDYEALRGTIARELSTAVGQNGGTLSAARLKAAQYYEGANLGNEIKGRSSVVSRTVLETIEWVLPQLLRIFTASDKIADIEPLRQDQEPAAEQATQYISHIFYRDNPGFTILHDWFKDALLYRLGWIKVYWDETRAEEINTYKGLTGDEYRALLLPGVEVVRESAYQAPSDEFDEDAPRPDAAGQMLYDCTLRTRPEGRVRIAAVPPEEVLFSNRARAVDDIPFIAHRRQRTVSDLVSDGYDKDSALAAAGPDEPEYSSEVLERFSDDSPFPYADNRLDESMRLVWIDECYLRYDVDGDGRAELVKVTTGSNGRAILTRDGKPDVEQVDEIPLIGITPIPTPHKLAGLSLADLVMDLQFIKSTVVRQILDNLYLTNSPRVILGKEAHDGAHTLNDLLTHRPGSPIRAKDASQVVPWVIPFVAEKAFPLLEYIDQTTETRTGVNRRNQGLSTDALNQSSSGYKENILQQAMQQRVELIARIFAETGVKKLVQHILGLVTRYQQHERIIRLTGKWVTMDPRLWRDSMDVSVSVGLGTGNRDQIAAHVSNILQVQQTILSAAAHAQAPQFAALVQPKNIYDATETLSEALGFKQSYFTDPDEAPQPGTQPAQPPPNPEMVKAQHGMQLAQQQAQLDQQEQQARLAADLQIQQAKLQGDQQAAQQRAAFEMELEKTKAQHAMDLELQRETSKADLARYEIDARARAGAYTSGPAPQ